MGKFAEELPKRLSTSFTESMKVLRDKDFQKLVVDYPRPKKTFIETIDTEDDVSSARMFGGYKPEDYRLAFSHFVKESPEHIEAIRTLLDRPKDWSTTALGELRQKLAANPLRFSIDNLQKAHQIRYHKALADAISMVKHAADETEPLLTAAERVSRAMAKVWAGSALTPDQRRWLERIGDHLVANLSIDRDDFDLIPALSDEGGFKAANKAFAGRPATVLAQLNEAVAA